MSKDHGNVLLDGHATRNSFWAPALLKLHVRLSGIQIRNAFGEGALFFFSTRLFPPVYWSCVRRVRYPLRTGKTLQGKPCSQPGGRQAAAVR